MLSTPLFSPRPPLVLYYSVALPFIWTFIFPLHNSTYHLPVMGSSSNRPLQSRHSGTSPKPRLLAKSSINCPPPLPRPRWPPPNSLESTFMYEVVYNLNLGGPVLVLKLNAPGDLQSRSTREASHRQIRARMTNLSGYNCSSLSNPCPTRYQRHGNSTLFLYKAPLRCHHSATVSSKHWDDDRHGTPRAREKKL